MGLIFWLLFLNKPIQGTKETSKAARVVSVATKEATRAIKEASVATKEASREVSRVIRLVSTKASVTTTTLVHQTTSSEANSSTLETSEVVLDLEDKDHLSSKETPTNSHLRTLQAQTSEVTMDGR